MLNNKYGAIDDCSTFIVEKDTDLGPDVFNPRLHKSSFLRLDVAVPVLTTAIDHSTVDTFQYVPATRHTHERSYSTLSPVSAGMGDRLWAVIPPRYVTRQLGQLSLASLWGR